MGIDELLNEKRSDILRIVAKHGAANVRIFGSVARGKAGPTSDIDYIDFRRLFSPVLIYHRPDQLRNFHII